MAVLFINHSSCIAEIIMPRYKKVAELFAAHIQKRRQQFQDMG